MGRGPGAPQLLLCLSPLQAEGFQGPTQMSAEGPSTAATGPSWGREVVARSSERHGCRVCTGRASGRLPPSPFLPAVHTGSPRAMLGDAQGEAASLAFVAPKPDLEVIVLQGREPAKCHVRCDREEILHDQGAGRGRQCHWKWRAATEARAGHGGSRTPSFGGPGRRDRRDHQSRWLDGRPEDPCQMGASQIVDCVKKRGTPSPHND